MLKVISSVINQVTFLQFQW